MPDVPNLTVDEALVAVLEALAQERGRDLRSGFAQFAQVALGRILEREVAAAGRPAEQRLQELDRLLEAVEEVHAAVVDRIRDDRPDRPAPDRAPGAEGPIPLTSYAVTMPIMVYVHVDVHEVEGGGYYAEVREFPGCVAQADTREELDAGIREGMHGYYGEPGVQTEREARKLAALHGGEIPPGPYPRQVRDVPPGWTEADEDW